MKTINERIRQKSASIYFQRGMMSGHLERAQTTTNPSFLRLADLAVAFAGPNGHAEFRQGELKSFLNVKDARTVGKAIDEAVGYGLLADGSHSRCLQIPLGQWQPFFGGGTANEQKRKASAPCASCGGVDDPAQCGHSHRKRYSSVENGSLCQQCWRSRKEAEKRVPLSVVDDDEAFEALAMQEPPDELSA